MLFTKVGVASGVSGDFWGPFFILGWEENSIFLEAHNPEGNFGGGKLPGGLV